MDLGIADRWAIVCASSQGLGLACAQALGREGVNIVINGRNEEKLFHAAALLREVVSAQVVTVVGDVTTDEGRAALLAAAPACDILVNNNSGPSPRYFSDMDHAGWLATMEANMMPALLLTNGVLLGMKERRFGRIINITSAMVTTPRAHMASSAAPRCALTGAMKALSLEVAEFNVTVNNLLPERINTERQEYMARQTMQRENISYEEARAGQVKSIAAKRLGDPEEFGATCAFLCSRYAGYMSGLNIHLDGGSYPALV